MLPGSEIVARAAGGDEVAVAILLAESRPAMRAYLAARIPALFRSVIDADDVLQEAYVSVFLAFRSFKDQGEGSFERWLSAIALRKLRDSIRAQRAQRRGGGRAAITEINADRDRSLIGLLSLLSSGGSTPSGAAARIEAVAALEQAVRGLPEQYREAIELVYLRGLPVAVAAAALAKTERAIHGLCRRGLEQLQREMGTASRFFSSTG